MCELKYFCHISKQRMLWASNHHITASPMVRMNPEGTQEGKKEYPPSNSQLLQPSTSPPRWCSLRKLRIRKHRTVVPDNRGTYQRNDFSEPRLLQLPIHRKALNSSLCNICLSLTKNNILMFWLPDLCCKNSYISYLPASPPQRSLSALFEILSPELEVPRMPTK